MSVEGIGAVIDFLDTETVAETNRLGSELVKEIKGFTPVITGKLREGWTMHPITKLNESLIVENLVEYAAYVNNGTHKMAPRMMLERGINKVMGRTALGWSKL